MSTDDATPTRKPLHGTQAELERTQIWWLRWVYGPTMSAIAVAALVVTALDGFDNLLAWVVFAITAGGLVGATVQFRRQRATYGRLSLDERDETRTMRTMGYGFCFAYFGGLIWAVVWAADHDSSAFPTPIGALAGLTLCLLLGRACTAREGFSG